jgi:hypothetical protein
LLSVLCQSGYLTIKNYDKEFHHYNLDFPNPKTRQDLEKIMKIRGKPELKSQQNKTKKRDHKR